MTFLSPAGFWLSLLLPLVVLLYLLKLRRTEVLSPQEVNPDLRGDFKLMDMADADLVEVSLTGTLVKSYERTLAAFRAGLSKDCSKFGMAYTFSSTAVPFDELVLLYLRRAGLVK